ncbi:hypothetical protein SESBI_13219 [Sesbania bispinosa]|nr:hypothetical protein SESBI_13219 [Sesbania bispinosa]
MTSTPIETLDIGHYSEAPSSEGRYFGRGCRVVEATKHSHKISPIPSLCSNPSTLSFWTRMKTTFDEDFAIH